MSLAALGVSLLGAGSGSLAGSAISGKPEYGLVTTEQNVTNKFLDPKQLQQILNDLTQAEQTGRGDISSNYMQALGILQGDPNYGARQEQENLIKSQSDKQVRNQLGSQIFNFLAPQGDLYNSLKGIQSQGGSDSYDMLLKRNLREGKITPSQIQVNPQDGTFTIKNMQSYSDKGNYIDHTYSITDPNLLQSLNNFQNQVNQVAQPQLAQFRQDNPQLYSSQSSRMDPFLAQNQQINLNALNQMAALSGIQGSNGQAALTPEEIMSKLQATPGYQFRFDQGKQAVERAGSARGLLESGAILKGLTEFGQGLASQEFGAEHERLAKLAGLTSNAGLLGANQVQHQADILTNQGNNLANLATQAAAQRSSALLSGGKNTSITNKNKLLDTSGGLLRPIPGI